MYGGSEGESGACSNQYFLAGEGCGSLTHCPGLGKMRRPPKHVVVLANGSWEVLDRVRSIACSADEVIAADGAWAKAEKLGINVDLVVGDLDSLKEEAMKSLATSGVPVMRFPVDKDRTDTEIAVDLALERQARRISICGAGGGRLDHTLANILLLGKPASLGQREVRLEFITATETIVWVEDEFVVEGAVPGDRISLVPVDRAVRVSTSGLRFPLSNELLWRTKARGISNEVCTLPVRICISEGAALVIHAPARARTPTSANGPGS